MNKGILPPGFDVVESGTGRTIDATIGYRRTGENSWRLVLSFGKRSVARFGFDTNGPVYAMVGVDWPNNRLALVFDARQQPNYIKGHYKDGTLYFHVRLERLGHHRLKQPATPVEFEHDSANPTLVIVQMPTWVKQAAAARIDNSTGAATARAADAATAARLRMAAR